jgi:hypothetical protein
MDEYERSPDSPGTRPQRNPEKAPGNLLPRCRKMRQHGQRYFHAGHRRPSPAVKWHHATRARIRFPQPGGPAGQARREDPRPGSAAVARSSAGRRAPAARQGSLRARSTRAAARARGGLAWIAAGRDRAHTTALPVAAVAAPPCSRRSCRPPCADPSPAPAMTLGGRPL